MLGLPLLVTNDDGSVHEPFARMGGVRIAEPTQRRRRRSALKRRRPTMSMRRQPGNVTEATPIHRDEREIIARDRRLLAALKLDDAADLQT
jgi:hypothetical protein